MANILSPADKEVMVSAFLEIAAGQTADTARQFLGAANWRLEDAMQLFYVRDEGSVATSSSSVPPVAYTALLSDHNYSGLEADMSYVYGSNGDGDEACPPLPVISEGVYAAAATYGSTMVVSSLMQFSPTELDSAAPMSEATPTPSSSAPSNIFRKRRTHAEIVTTAQSSRANLRMPAVTPAVTCRRRRSRAEMDAAVLSSRGDLVSLGTALPTTHSQQHTLTEEPSLPQLHLVPPSSDVEGSSCNTRTASKDFTYSRQSKRLKDVQGLPPLQKHMAGSSNHVGNTTSDFTFSRQSRRRTNIQEVPALRDDGQGSGGDRGRFENERALMESLS